MWFSRLFFGVVVFLAFVDFCFTFAWAVVLSPVVLGVRVKVRRVCIRCLPACSSFAYVGPLVFRRVPGGVGVRVP